ncbi:hypothetical protein EW146_g2979 [Bondarzewia mesenterica]|uniref:NADP-dependent oxidoreductase domain-containing protein n=1 Tax=Bondarzewia mesenterica TaxID=1095465 RepID=A0A4S4M0U7_9AGAM|nr:hypothetical protein EW146_g2979 [Bondarzewia mesenterica]
MSHSPPPPTAPSASGQARSEQGDRNMPFSFTPTPMVFPTVYFPATSSKPDAPAIRQMKFERITWRVTQQHIQEQWLMLRMLKLQEQEEELRLREAEQHIGSIRHSMEWYSISRVSDDEDEALSEDSTPSDAEADQCIFRIGHSIPSIAFGTWTLGKGQAPIDQVDQALSIGFNHIDTAQSYRNEEEAGLALRESGLARSDVFITTKYSGSGGLDIETSIQNSLKNLGVSYVDLYLIHSPRLATPDIPTAWAKMEKIKKDGLARSIGVSNFGVPELEALLASAKITPAANQILFHPYVYAQQLPILSFGAQHGIVTEAYSALTPITHQPGGPVDKPVNAIASRLGATADQVILAWVKAKGAVAVTQVSSTKKFRLEGYLSAGDLALTEDDVAAIDAAGAKGARQQTARKVLRRAAVITLVGAAALKVCGSLRYGF